MQKREDARVQVVREWRAWRASEKLDRPSGNDVFRFYGWLLREKSWLLDFRARGADKWQTVHGWIATADRDVTD